MDEAVANAMPCCVNRGKRTKRPSKMAFSDEEVEDKDMAECLILLARGVESKTDAKKRKRLVELEMGSYECKTCDKKFQSFQALGGHRAGHRKSDQHSSPETDTFPGRDDVVFHTSPTATPTNISNNENDNVLTAKSTTHQSSKIHQCSICGAEFSSGQALGGHMRRHRSVLIPVRSTVLAAPLSSGGTDNYHQSGSSSEFGDVKTLSTFDLNLPAPENGEEDRHNASFHHHPRGTLVSFSAPTVVGCHY